MHRDWVPHAVRTQVQCSFPLIRDLNIQIHHSMRTCESSRQMSCFLPAGLLCMVLLMTGSTRASASLLGYWQFEEGAGTTTADSSGNGLTGTLAGSPIPVWVTPGAVGSGALDFTPTARVSLGNPALLQLTGPLTLTAWTLADTVSGSGRVITKGGNSGSRGWSLGVEALGYYSFQIPSSSTVLAVCNTAPGTVALGTWTHLAAVYDPTALSMKLYINGALATTTNSLVIPATMFNPASIAVSIGTRSDGTTRWDGKLDEIRIYNEALSAAQIAALVPEPSTLAICATSAALLGLRCSVRVRRQRIQGEVLGG